MEGNMVRFSEDPRDQLVASMQSLADAVRASDATLSAQLKEAADYLESSDVSRSHVENLITCVEKVGDLASNAEIDRARGAASRLYSVD